MLIGPVLFDASNPHSPFLALVIQTLQNITHKKCLESSNSTKKLLIIIENHTPSSILAS